MLKSVTVMAAVLCPPVCISGIGKKAYMCGQSIRLIQPFVLFIGEECTNMVLPC